MARPSALLLAAVAIAVGGCGGTLGSDRPNLPATLVLDSQPSAAHVGIYVAVARGYDEAEGVELRIRRPSSVTEPARLLLDGTAQLAVLDLHDLAIQRARGHDLVAVMTIAQLPIRERAVTTLRALGRARIADRLRLASAPAYPELVLATTREELDEERPLVRAAVRAITRGYGEELDDPDTALSLELSRVPAARRAEVRDGLNGVEEAFTGPSGRVGAFDKSVMRAWARWEAKIGVVRRPPDLGAMLAPISAPSSSY